MKKKPRKPARRGHARTRARTTTRKPPARGGRRQSAVTDSLLAPIAGATRRVVGGVTIDVFAAGNGRIKRVVYPAGFRWSQHMKPVVGTDLCMHAHVGFLARGRVRGTYRDGCVFDLAAPRCVVIEPGHDAEVVGDQPAVLIEFDAAADTARRFGLPAEHRHS
jgi:hypothetical protein